MYLSVEMLAKREGVSVSTISRAYRRMEKTELFPNAVKMIGGIKINTEDFDNFLTRERRIKSGGKGDD